MLRYRRRRHTLTPRQTDERAKLHKLQQELSVLCHGTAKELERMAYDCDSEEMNSFLPDMVGRICIAAAAENKAQQEYQDSFRRPRRPLKTKPKKGQRK